MRRSLRTTRQLTTAALLLALAACAPRHAPPPLPPPAPPVTQPAPVEKPAKPPTPPPKPAAPAEAVPDLVLTGMSRPEVTKLLGEAKEQRDSTPGRLWIYRSGACTIEILFLLDIMRNDDFVVDHRVSGTDGTPKAEQACLRRIVKSQSNGK